MKILLLADIHANWPALAAIREPFDACFCLGDLVEYGADAASCIDWVQQNATAAIRGNHDHALIEAVPTKPTAGGMKQLAWATRPLNRRQLNSRQLKFLARLPVTQTLVLGGKRFHLVHATPRDPLDEYLQDDPQGWNARLQGVEADFVCVGHTHVPLHLSFGGMQLINPGSVGQPRDGDPRAAYAVVEDGVVRFERVEYDIEAAVESIRNSGLDEKTAWYAEQTLRNGGRPTSVS
jgi:putative phosphoesterase